MNSTKINWEAIQREYGIKSNRALAIEYGCAESAIRKRAKKEGWKNPKMRTKKVRTPEVRTNVIALPNKVGCPTKKTDELLEAIFEAIADGKSTRVMLAEMGISKTTFFRWARTDREFRHQYACAKQFCADFFIEDIIEIADDNSCDTYVDEKGRIIVDHEVIARSKIRIEARQWAAMRLNSRKYNLPMLDSTEDKPAIRRIEVSFVSGDGVVSAGRTFDQNGKVVQLGPVNRDSL